MASNSGSRKPHLRRIQNHDEELVRRHLKTIADLRKWRVYASIKLTDVVDPRPANVTTKDWTRATRQHLDFVITDEHRFPVFAVELDGAKHRGSAMVELDGIKDKVCEGAGLDLLRIESKHLAHLEDGRSIVEYLVDAYESALRLGADHWIHECSSECMPHPDAPDCIPNEITDYRHVGAYLQDGRFIFPNYLTNYARADLIKAALDGLLASSLIKQCTFVRKDGWVEALSWIPARPTGFVFSATQIRRYSFPSLDPCQLAMDLGMMDLAHEAKGLYQDRPIIVREIDITRHVEKTASYSVADVPGVHYHCANGLAKAKNHHCPWPPACSSLHDPTAL